MPMAIKICKVCGKEYEYCHTLRHIDGIFRYQDVACCPEHGSIYLSRIEASRTKNECNINSYNEPDKSSLDYSDLDECDDEEDAWFEEDFDDEDNSE